MLGTGAGNFTVIERSYAVKTINLEQVRFIVDTPKVVHNMYLEVQTELGVPGFAAFLSLIGAAFGVLLRAIKAAQTMGDRELEFLGRGVFVALVGFLASAIFGSFQYNKQLWLLLGLAIAMSSVVSRSEVGRAAREPSAR